jgi:hypothetical protein
MSGHILALPEAPIQPPIARIHKPSEVESMFLPTPTHSKTTQNPGLARDSREITWVLVFVAVLTARVTLCYDHTN